MIYLQKSINMFRLLCIIILALLVNTGYAVQHTGKPIKPVVKVVKRPAPVAPLVLQKDTATVIVRHLDSAALEAYRKLPEFQYNDYVKTSPSLWARFWHWLKSLFKPMKINSNAGRFWVVFGYIIQYLFIGAGLAAIVFLVLKLAGINMLNVFRRNPVSAGLEYSESLENIHEINFDDEIERAIAQHNYRFAVRLLYLRSLKHLSDANLIKWQLDKTNNAYVDELSNPDQHRFFKALTLQFEYIWYGEFAINAQAFSKINALFTDFKKSIS
ncbi:DUF4129 domain-containing protein [Mucilaginibacter angelicae]|uniref:DUF4129 domain-containing protein n=1 Tax=Mucilaginibacter angelicae TaxID=869718 RepID=A0ABV6L8X5_9SPHI